VPNDDDDEGMVLRDVTPCTLIYRYQTIWRRVGEYRDLNVHCCENITIHTDMEIICSVHGVTVFCDVTPCILFGSDERFGGTFCPNLPVKDGGRTPICPTTRKKEGMRFSPTFLFIP
jgi:hypothetical protein